MDSNGTEDMEERLASAGAGPLQKIRKLIGLNAVFQAKREV